MNPSYFLKSLLLEGEVECNLIGRNTKWEARRDNAINLGVAILGIYLNKGVQTLLKRFIIF